MRMQNKEKTEGFSIVELMVVIVIIGVLTQLAMSRYRMMVARSRQAEPQLNLKTIDDLQEAYYLENESYSTTNGTLGLDVCTATNKKNELGFRPKDCAELRYKYNWATSGTATAKSGTGASDDKIYPGCTQQDVWTLTYSSGGISNTTDVVDLCE